MLSSIMAALSGCIIIPTPHNEYPDSRDNRFIGSGREFEEGMATRRQVVFELGEPDEVSGDERELHYFYEADTAFWIVFIPPAYADGDFIHSDRCYLAEFDESGVLISFGEHDH